MNLEQLWSRIGALEDRYREVSLLITDPSVIADGKRYPVLMREYKELGNIIRLTSEYRATTNAIASTIELLRDDSDPEMREMAREELIELEAREEEQREEVRMALVPKDPNDTRDVIVEIRAGTGGDEASLFAGDLFRMYTRYLEDRGWSYEVANVNEGTAGGFKEIVFSVSGEEVYGTLKYESGVHRVQRVPATESQGRIHTSAATVAVLPEADEVDVDLNMADVRRDTFRSSGAGGQHVNKTESAIRLTHIPTGVVVECQDGRSQHKNYEKALTVLRTRLYELEQARLDSARAAERKTLVSTGDRSAKIRTYNFPQGRVTDHRINLTLYNLQAVLDGQLDDIIGPLRMAENMEKLKAGNA